MNKKGILRLLLGLQWLFLSAIAIVLVQSAHSVNSQIVLALSVEKKYALIFLIAALFITSEIRTVCKYKYEEIKFNSMITTTCVITSLFVIVTAYLINNLF